MKSKNPDGKPDFVPFDDTKLAHVEAGPDYGQPWSSSHAWVESGSKEYPAYVSHISHKILNNRIRFNSLFS